MNKKISNKIINLPSLVSNFLSDSADRGALGGVIDVKIGEAADVFFSTVDLGVEVKVLVAAGEATVADVAAAVAVLVKLANEGITETSFVVELAIGFAAFTGVVDGGIGAGIAAVVAVATRAYIITNYDYHLNKLINCKYNLQLMLQEEF